MAEINKESGQTSRLLLVLAVIVLVAVVIVFLIMKMAQKPPAPPVPQTVVALPVYEKTLGDIRIIFESSLDRGQDLTAPKKNTLHIDNPGAKFIQVTVAAQDVGNQLIGAGAWTIGNIVDSQGRNFVPEGSNLNAWLPTPNMCGAILHPSFDPVPCTKIYKVSKVSTGLKVVIISKKMQALLDLVVK